MAPRGSKLDFGRSPFSAADMAHTSYLFRNPRTLITGDGKGGFNPLAPRGRLPVRENAGEGTSAGAPKLDHLTNAYFDAWADGDRKSLIEIAKQLVSATADAHARQGIRPSAHPSVPWDFVQAIKAEVEGIPANERAIVARSIMGTFEPRVRPDVQRQIAMQWPPTPNRRSAMEKLNYDPSQPPQRDASNPRRIPRPAQAADVSNDAPGVRRQPSAVPLAAPNEEIADPQAPMRSAREDTAQGGQERRAAFVGGKVSKGPNGSTRAYRLGNQAFQVPSGEDEGDVVAGVNYLANQRVPNGRAPSSFANDLSGDGVIALDEYGRPMRRHNRPVRYSWEQLRQLGALASVEQGKTLPPTKQGMAIDWDDKPTEASNLPASWFAAQRKYRWGDGSDAVVDPVEWEFDKDSEEFASKAQRAATRDPQMKPRLADAIDMAAKTGKPQPIDMYLVTEGTPYNARGQVLGYYGLRVRGMVVVKDGRYMIVGRAVVDDTGAFNYKLDNLDQRSARGTVLLAAAHGVPDPTSNPLSVILPWPFNSVRVPIAFPGHDYKIRANREAKVRIWGTIK